MLLTPYLSHLSYPYQTHRFVHQFQIAYNMSGRSEAFRLLSPLRTVQVSFKTYGSSHHLPLQLAYLNFLNCNFINAIPSLLKGFIFFSLKNFWILSNSLPSPYFFNK